MVSYKEIYKIAMFYEKLAEDLEIRLKQTEQLVVKLLLERGAEE